MFNTKGSANTMMAVLITAVIGAGGFYLTQDQFETAKSAGRSQAAAKAKSAIEKRLQILAGDFSAAKGADNSVEVMTSSDFPAGSQDCLSANPNTSNSAHFQVIREINAGEVKYTCQKDGHANYIISAHFKKNDKNFSKKILIPNANFAAGPGALPPTPTPPPPPSGCVGEVLNASGIIHRSNPETDSTRPWFVSGARESLGVSQCVYEGDTIITAANSFARLRMKKNDGSFSNTYSLIGPESEYKIESFAYDSATNNQSSVFELLKGFVRSWFDDVVPGSDDIRIKTPSGSIGIRGTDFITIVDQADPGNINEFKDVQPIGGDGINDFGPVHGSKTTILLLKGRTQLDTISFANNGGLSMAVDPNAPAAVFETKLEAQVSAASGYDALVVVDRSRAEAAVTGDPTRLYPLGHFKLKRVKNGFGLLPYIGSNDLFTHDGDLNPASISNPDIEPVILSAITDLRLSIFNNIADGYNDLGVYTKWQRLMNTASLPCNCDDPRCHSNCNSSNTPNDINCPLQDNILRLCDVAITQR